MSNTSDMKRDKKGAPAPKILDIDALELPEMHKIARKLAKTKFSCEECQMPPSLITAPTQISYNFISARSRCP